MDGTTKPATGIIGTETLPRGLRGDYDRAQPDGTLPDAAVERSAADHATWRALVTRQRGIFPGRAASAWLEGLDCLRCDEAVPDLSNASEILEGATGWRLVPCPGLLPDAQFFALLAKRCFPVTEWIRRPEELDYIVEPDIFHDFLGHVPLLTNRHYADFLEAYGQLGLQAERRGQLAPLARFYWFMVEFGLIAERDGLRAYGAGILSSRTETLHALSAAPRRLRFDLRRVLRSTYRIDEVQPVYFVIEDYAELYDAVGSAAGLLDEAMSASPIPPGGQASGDRGWG
ncbi:phenylalanine 4-monooxygenase [Roseomonas sp. KE2513]|uniref:phenylalanine 4-monooxygenase n=1 Tax=Roseomonas sp. KE2513 TaxID=2479202 RepID=UPI0018E0618F|nr:phenylalanine 4-monooxygenase [Roseomonas sp. KE2513]MBI0536807.1 phenylalanine 4-monooxygenase [Roseomonas sp. KE2513]